MSQLTPLLSFSYTCKRVSGGVFSTTNPPKKLNRSIGDLVYALSILPIFMSRIGLFLFIFFLLEVVTRNKKKSCTNLFMLVFIYDSTMYVFVYVSVKVWKYLEK